MDGWGSSRHGWSRRAVLLGAGIVLAAAGATSRAPASELVEAGSPSSIPSDAGLSARDEEADAVAAPVEPADAGRAASGAVEGGAPDARAPAPAPAAPPRSALKVAQRALGLTLQREPTLRVGPRMGGSLNFDQWLVGGQILGDSIGIDALGLEAMFLVGLGGNHVTLRPAARLLYTFWIGGHRGLGLAPTVGASALIYVPVGDFAEFCHRVDLHGCGGWDLGMDLGGSLRFRWLRLEATAGFFGIPRATITFAFDIPVGRPRPAEPPHAGVTP